MSENLTDTLDLALERLRAGESPLTILADYPAETDQLRPLLEAAASLEMIPAVTPLPVEIFQTDRADFVVQVTALQQQAVSPGLFVRLKERIVHALPWSLLNFTPQEGRKRRMSALLIKAMLVVGLMFGSVGGTAALAAESLPDSPLYPVKLTMEEARLALSFGPTEQARLHLAMAQERTAEMQQLALQGDVPGEATLARLQHHLNSAFQLAGQLSDAEMAKLLTEARQMSQNRARQMSQTQVQVDEPAQERLEQANQLLSRAGRDADAGLRDPATFRNRFGHNRPEDAPIQPITEPDLPDEPLPLQGAEPAGDQNQYGQDPDAEPGQHGDCETPTECEPVGDQNQYGQDSDTLPGQHGDCDTPGECEPAGDENKYGQDPDAEAGQHGDCDTPGECEPAGNENKYGQDSNELDEVAPTPDDNDGAVQGEPQPDSGNDHGHGSSDDGGGGGCGGCGDSGGRKGGGK